MEENAEAAEVAVHKQIAYNQHRFMTFGLGCLHLIMNIAAHFQVA